MHSTALVTILIGSVQYQLTVLDNHLFALHFNRFLLILIFNKRIVVVVVLIDGAIAGAVVVAVVDDVVMVVVVIVRVIVFKRLFLDNPIAVYVQIQIQIVIMIETSFRRTIIVIGIV